jgi:type VI secretion system secreted protein Hcp
MAMVYFLKINGIPGESIDDVHKDEIAVLSVAWGVSQSGTAAAGAGTTAGKAAFQDFTFVMGLNRSSPALMLACAQGQMIKEAVLTARKSGASQPDFFEVKLSDLIVSAFQETAEIEVLQQVSLNYSRIEYSYKRQKADGSLESPVSEGWDLAKNVKI